MTEVARDRTPQNPNKRNKHTAHSGNIPIEQGGERPSLRYTDFELLSEALKAGKVTNVRQDPSTGEFIADIPDTIADIKDPGSSRRTEHYVPLGDAEKPPFWTRNKKIGAIVAGASVLATGVAFGVAKAMGDNSPSAAPATVPSASAPVDPSAQPSSSESAPGSPETEAPLESDQTTADKIIARSNSEFFDPEQTSRRDQQLAVDGVLAKQLMGGPDSTVFTQKTFDSKTDEPIFTKSPLFAAAERQMENEKRIAEGNTPLERQTPQDILNAIGAQGILDQVRFQYNNVFAQIVDADNPKALDQNKAVNMLAGLYDDPTSDEAQELRRLIENQTTIDAPYGTSDRWVLQSSLNGDEQPSASERVLTHDFGDGEQTPYIVINYLDESDDPRYMIVTPKETSFNSLSAYDLKSIVTLEPTKWLIVKEGDGRENTEGKLGQ